MVCLTARHNYSKDWLVAADDPWNTGLIFSTAPVKYSCHLAMIRSASDDPLIAIRGYTLSKRAGFSICRYGTSRKVLQRCIRLFYCIAVLRLLRPKAAYIREQRSVFAVSRTQT